MNDIDLTLSIQEIRNITGLSVHRATDLCKRFGFICSYSWCISESVLRRIMKSDLSKAMRKSPVEVLPRAACWKSPVVEPPQPQEEVIVLTAAGEMKLIEYKQHKRLKYPVRFYMPKPDLPCKKEDLI